MKIVLGNLMYLNQYKCKSISLCVTISPLNRRTDFDKLSYKDIVHFKLKKRMHGFYYYDQLYYINNVFVCIKFKNVNTYF